MLLGINQLQTSVDHLKTTIDRLNTGLSQVLPQLQTTSHLMAGGGFMNAMGSVLVGHAAGGGGGNNNAGSPTFDGVPAAAHGQGGGGQQGGGGGAGGGGGQKTPNGGFRGPAAATLGMGAFQSAQAGISQAYRSNLTDALKFDLVQSQLSQYGYGSYDDIKRSLRSQYSAMNATDVAQTRMMITQGLNVKQDSATDRRMMGSIAGVSFSNPSISNAQGAAYTQAINQPWSLAKLRTMGITPGPGRGGKMDINSLAQQIINAVPNAQNVRTDDQINAQLDEPGGAINLTIQNWEAMGYLPAGQTEVIKEAIRSILKAKAKGVSSQQLTDIQ
jgi:hypothetical protein